MAFTPGFSGNHLAIDSYSFGVIFAQSDKQELVVVYRSPLHIWVVRLTFFRVGRPTNVADGVVVLVSRHTEVFSNYFSFNLVGDEI